MALRPRRAVFTGGTQPMVKTLKASIAASIGRTIARYSHLEYLQINILCMLCGISIKQGRVAIRLPRPRMFITVVQDLLEYHGLHSDFNFNALGKKLDNAEIARNTLAHSLFMQDRETRKTLIQLVNGSWDLPQDTVRVSRALQPEARAIDRAYLSAQRKLVEDAIKQVMMLAHVVVIMMHTSNEIRRTQASRNRRRQ